MKTGIRHLLKDRVADKLGDVQGRIFSVRFGICCRNWWWIERDFRPVRTVD